MPRAAQRARRSAAAAASRPGVRDGVQSEQIPFCLSGECCEGGCKHLESRSGTLFIKSWLRRELSLPDYRISASSMRPMSRSRCRRVRGELAFSRYEIIEWTLGLKVVTICVWEMSFEVRALPTIYHEKHLTSLWGCLLVIATMSLRSCPSILGRLHPLTTCRYRQRDTGLH